MTYYVIRPDKKSNKDKYKVTQLVMKSNGMSLKKAQILKRNLSHDEAVELRNKLKLKI